MNKNYTKCIQQSMYITCVYNDCTNENSTWSWMYKKCTSNSNIYTNTAQTVHSLYKIQTENSLKFVKYVFFYIRTKLANWNHYYISYM